MVQELCRQTSFWTLDFVLPLDTRFLKAACLGSKLLLVPWSLYCLWAQLENPRTSLQPAGAFEPSLRYPPLLLPPLLRPWWIEHFVKIKASLRGSYYPPIPPSLPHLGTCGPSMSGFRILQSGCLIFFRFSSSGGKQPLHLPSFSFIFSLCALPVVNKYLFLPVRWELSCYLLLCGLLAHRHLPPPRTEMLQSTNPFRCFLFLSKNCGLYK